MREEQGDHIALMRAVTARAVSMLEPACGSKMVAYQKVAAAVGVSASWLRKFITIAGTPEPRWSVGCRLIDYYKSLCDRMDDEVAGQRREIAKIIGEINEADPFADDVPLAVSLAKRLGLNTDG